MTPERPVSLGRRVLPAVAVASAAGALYLALDRPAASTLTVTGEAWADDSVTSSTSAASSITAAPGVTTTVPPAPSATAAAPATTATAESCTSEVIAGSVVSTRFGPIQVAARLDADGGLCDVSVLQYPDGDRHSLSINERAIPVLNRQALAAGSADIDGVSGATVTTRGYQQSLQAILDSQG